MDAVEARVGALERALERHLGGCEQQNVAVKETLERLEKAINGIYAKAWKVAFMVIGAQGAVGLALFTAWLALRK